MPKNNKRYDELSQYERDAERQGYNIIAGVDEAGRGPLAGPVVAAACIIPPQHYIEGLDDSKKLSPKKRKALYDLLIANPNISYGVGIIEPEIIDEINIFQATILAMINAVDALKIPPQYILVDGLSLPHKTIPTQKIIKGDTLSYSIAAASIIAKETRDNIMLEYHKQYPQYSFDKHKGYPTKTHVACLHEYGPTPIHRMTFKGLRAP
ncbi:MAG: ribonuclease HII [Waddliaceae bacterium]|jgi:ribonuclease HII|nr:ribonuclease HII [Waddliaceae bacterium]MBT3579188.1 ribonuclease HII [Waddliaceae bacterium]MBT4444752.1 ribonuclease HII [Waddliaceae bacterium]MBT6928888.1 ribonuclease HII [Waddliaceae bacterium]MBT7264136.1 ribonuclease HII [Waddliaceae bacterium]